MPASIDSWEIVRDPDALRALEPEWNALWERAGDAYATLRFAWCWAAWTEVAQPMGRRLHCVVGRSGGAVTLIWPFVVYRHALWQRARPLAPEVAEYSGVLVAPDALRGEHVAGAWQTLRRTARADAVLLPHVPAGTVLHTFLSTLRAPMLTQTTPLSSTRREDAADAEAVAKMFDSRSLARHRRRFEKHGEVRIERVTDPAERTRIVDWTLEQKRAWLTRTGNHELWGSTARYRDFLHAVVADERFEVFALLLKGEPAASCIARADNARFEQFLSSYDPEYKPYSPGQLLRVEAMAWAFERGLEYDLRVGEHEYKKDWTNRKSFAVSYHIATSPWGVVPIAARRAQQALSARRESSAAASGS
jgi:CelD/BcsL family acetyltransferase involved in cellulose biosynthesis